jgi:hypothetical protein
MRKKTLARFGTGSGWSHPYGHGPFSPFLYADGGDDGDSGSGSGDGGTGADSGDDSAGTGDTGDTDDAGGSGDGGSGGTGDVKDTAKSDKNGDTDDSAATIARLEKELAYARKDAGKARTAAKQQAADDAVKELTAKLGKALGFVKDDTPPDPQALASAIAQKDTTISEKESALRAKDVELAVWSRADSLSAKAGALLDSRAFVAKLAALDPAEEGFTAALDKAIKDAVKDNPAFAAVQPAGKSGADLSGGTGETKATRTGSLAGAIKTHYGT